MYRSLIRNLNNKKYINFKNMLVIYILGNCFQKMCVLCIVKEVLELVLY